jgi:hypothetical protein
MTPDWFLDKAKKILFAMEYGQEYREAAKDLWLDINQRYPCTTKPEGRCTGCCASSESTGGSRNPDTSTTCA